MCEPGPDARVCCARTERAEMRVGAEARCVWYGRSRAGRAHAGKEPPGGGSLPDGVREGALPGVHTPALLTGPVCRADRPWTSLASTGLAP